MEKTNIPACMSRLKEYKTVFLLWMATGALYGIIKFLIGKYNNYKIYEGVFGHAVGGSSLYASYPEYYDSNHYGILFSLVIAPFSMLPHWAGIVLWIMGNTALLYYAIRQLPLTRRQKIFVYWFAYCELMTAQGVQQFNISICAIILLTFVLIEKKRDFWAACILVAGTFIKLYPVVGFAFFFFSRRKMTLIFSSLFWAVLFFFLPVLYTPGVDYMVSQYVEWFHSLMLKNGENMFAVSQNISLLGLVRKVSGSAAYSDLWLIVPGLILFCLSYLRVSQYRYLRFRLMMLAHVLLFVVLFSTGSEASGYVLVMTGVALWYLSTPSTHRRYNRWLLVVTLVVVSISTTELVPPFIRKYVIIPYVLKVWPCILVWFTVCYDMCFRDFGARLRNKPKL
ncbi:MAG: DUF2029 domain-containing protein [Tannerellaceae bacterium]|jgi:hypothetical protein|nr:DUF2029 domain-containing protein [Tannerellaceae bacterium]